jgi:ABC-type multidrug transport system ATPase subunit
MRTPPILEFRAVTRRWRAGILGASAEVTALSDCSFTLRAGEILAVTGLAGAGKSTLLLLAAGRVLPTEGYVRWYGALDPGPTRPQLIGARPWEYHFLTVRQAIAFHADVLALQDAALPAPTRYLPLMRQVGLRGMSRVRLGALSALDKLRVVIAQALLARPALLCLDEPFAYCGPAERAEGIALLRRLADRGMAIAVAGREANVCGGQGTADSVIQLETGRVADASMARRTVLELAVPSAEDALARLLPRLPSVARRGRRVRVPLRGTSPEAVLALCRDAGVSVRGSRVAEEATPRAAHSLPDAADAPPGATEPLPHPEPTP